MSDLWNFTEWLKYSGNGLWHLTSPQATGSRVRIASRAVLEQFLRSWKYHNYAGQSAEIESVSFYHGGDELYKLNGIPGVWHSQCSLPGRDDGAG